MPEAQLHACHVRNCQSDEATRIETYLPCIISMILTIFRHCQGRSCCRISSGMGLYPLLYPSSPSPRSCPQRSSDLSGSPSTDSTDRLCSMNLPPCCSALAGNVGQSPVQWLTLLALSLLRVHFALPSISASLPGCLRHASK